MESEQLTICWDFNCILDLQIIEISISEPTSYQKKKVSNTAIGGDGPLDPSGPINLLSVLSVLLCWALVFVVLKLLRSCVVFPWPAKFPPRVITQPRNNVLHLCYIVSPFLVCLSTCHIITLIQLLFQREWTEQSVLNVAIVSVLTQRQSILQLAQENNTDWHNVCCFILESFLLACLCDMVTW